MSSVVLWSCGDPPTPKPKAYLRLDYPEAVYKKTRTPLPFSFEKNNFSAPLSALKINTSNKAYGVDIHYPQMKGTVYLTYKKVEHNNLTSLLRDAQNLTQKHVYKADEIIEERYVNKAHKVYGMFYEVGGNAASQSQFYVTDSTHHFITGSLYFYAKPNYDSIYPAAVYLKNDIRHIMETIQWKE